MGKQHYPRPVRVMPIVLKIPTSESRRARDRVWVNSIAVDSEGECERRTIETGGRGQSCHSSDRDVSSYPPISPHRPSLIAKLKAISTDSESEFDAIYRARESRDSFRAEITRDLWTRRPFFIVVVERISVTFLSRPKGAEKEYRNYIVA